MAGTISKTTSYVNINFGNLILSAALLVNEPPGIAGLPFV